MFSSLKGPERTGGGFAPNLFLCCIYQTTTADDLLRIISKKRKSGHKVRKIRQSTSPNRLVLPSNVIFQAARQTCAVGNAPIDSYNIYAREARPEAPAGKAFRPSANRLKNVLDYFSQLDE